MTYQVQSLDDFQVACQVSADSTAGAPPACASYLALTENCLLNTRYLMSVSPNSTINIARRVSFHKYTVSEFSHCQPYPDPNDPRNVVASPCKQPPDSRRVAGLVDPGDEQTYDFPDLLPASLVVGIDLQNPASGEVSDYHTQLIGTTIADLTFFVPQTQKSIFYKPNDSPPYMPVTDVVNDADTLIKTRYDVNGRTRYEIAVTITYFDKLVQPQVFGLRALHPIDDVCLSHGYPTSPRRRQFDIIQNAAISEGSRATQSFTRTGTDGIARSYVVYAEGVTGSSRASTSGLYRFDMCDEYAPLTYAEALESPSNIPFAGTQEAFDLSQFRTDVTNGHPQKYSAYKLCPYALDQRNYEGWEAFQNYYNPVSPCKGRIADRLRNPLLNYSVPFFNSPPPTRLRAARPAGPVSTIDGKSLLSRAPGTYPHVTTAFYSAIDYAYLFAHRDDPLVHMQDMITHEARAVTLRTLCGDGGQLWLIFGHTGIYVPVGGIPREQTHAEQNYFYAWNDRFAVTPGGNMQQCTAGGTTAVLAQFGGNAILGCFELQIFTTPVNTGATYAINLFEFGDYIFLVRLNQGGYLPSGSVTRKNIANQAPVFIDPTWPRNTNPANSTRTTTPGVLSPVATLDKYTFGGILCRVVILQETAPPPINIPSLVTSLSQSFVTLNGTSTQIINGAKMFASPFTNFVSINVTGNLSVHGSAVVTGNVATTDILVTGLVDSVSISQFYTNVDYFLRTISEKIAALEQRVCTHIEGARCIAISRPTSCYPLPELLAHGWESLASSFRGFFLARYPLVVMEELSFFPKSNTFIFVLKNASSAATINVTDYFNADYCLPYPGPVVPVGYTRLEKFVRFADIPCDTLTQTTQEVFVSTVASYLAVFGVKKTDLLVLDVSCIDMTTITFQVIVPNGISLLTASKLDTYNFWYPVYYDLLDDADHWYGLFEYAIDQFLPYTPTTPASLGILGFNLGLFDLQLGLYGYLL